MRHLKFGFLGSLVALACVGCGAAPEARFEFNKPTLELSGQSGLNAQGAVKTALLENFGTPQKLVAWKKLPINFGDAKATVDGLKPEDTAHEGWNLKLGRNLYMKHCLHCHGVSGDGAGPTAPYLNPRPRDYRQGVFKFTSTTTTSKACRDDLKRILQAGIPGTSMPSFVLLKDYELNSLVEYVRFLAMRGELEKRLAAELATDYSTKALDQRTKGGEKRADIAKTFKDYMEGKGDTTFKNTVTETADSLATDWSAAEDESNLIVPKVPRTESTKESIARGRALFMSEKAKCYSCHGAGGKGDGQSTVDYWPIPGTTPELKYSDRGLHDTWGNAQKPRNLTLGQYRGGRRPLDVYRRIYAGIKGTQMAGFGGTVFNDQDMWDIVNYVLNIPYEQQTPATVLQAETKH
ncbi:MAG: cytochrome c [Planctomycetales bacterium]